MLAMSTTIDGEAAYTVEQLLSLFTNRTNVENAMYNPMHRFKGPNGPVLAAVRIQCNWRRYKAYSAFRQLKYLMEKAAVIQKKYRLYTLKKQTRAKVH